MVTAFRVGQVALVVRQRSAHRSVALCLCINEVSLTKPARLLLLVVASKNISDINVVGLDVSIYIRCT